ncbi:hypothetical protein IPZ55_29135 [Streptomyces sp. A10(2020)]|uniref:hypothetical protein n=1 Tax=Streptomyces sp. A10(2020) TaxID=2782013 RepID=UPI001F5D4592|nr:hypothetical protein [Streptomyces sp. A10(2020)]UNR60314.1 hypothetical protein IPZ55_29135 [Streptomyces sp. A10(2020)]
MPTLAIVGAGPGLGLSIAKVFGGHGYQVALISRSKDKLDGSGSRAGRRGVDVTAGGLRLADVAAPDALTAALRSAAARFRPDRRAGVPRPTRA